MAATFCPAVIIVEPPTQLVPGDCDIAGCTRLASYAVGNYYLCTECLIEGCETEKIPRGTTVARVAPRAWWS